MNKEEFLSIAGRYYEEFTSLRSAPNFYEYEKRLGQEYMEEQLNASSATVDRRKKKLLPDLERSLC